MNYWSYFDEIWWVRTIIVIRWVRPYSSVCYNIVLKTRGSRVRTSVWPKFYSTFENTFLGKYCQKLCHNAANRQLWYGSKFNVSSIPRYGTRRAHIPRKPLDPTTSWIVTQSLIYIIPIFWVGDPLTPPLHPPLPPPLSAFLNEGKAVESWWCLRGRAIQDDCSFQCRLLGMSLWHWGRILAPSTWSQFIDLNAIATVMLGEVGKISPSKSAGGDAGGLQHRHLPEFSTHNHQLDGRSRNSPTRDRTHYRQWLSPGPRVHQQNVCSLC